MTFSFYPERAKKMRLATAGTAAIGQNHRVPAAAKRSVSNHVKH
jgi:hypothetical protein